MSANQIDDYELLANISTPGARVAFVERLAGIGYWELDVQHRKIYCSDEIYHILGADLAIRDSLSLRDIMPSSDYDVFFKALRKLYHYKKKINLEIRLIGADKNLINCQLRADFFYIREFAVIAGTIQDLSDLIETKKQLIAARNEAWQLNKEKSYFLAQASHDLRQPLHALSMYLDLFCTNNLTTSQRNLWKKINLTAESLKSLLNNVLDLSRLDYGSTSVKRAKFNIGMLLSDLGREFSSFAECKKISFEYSVCNCKINSDAFLVERILRNLLSNAFKFATAKVAINCRETAHDIQISIEDDGQGISLEDQKHIFEEFFRGQNSYDQMADGAGLGLAIVKKISTLLHAEIKVRSNPEHGSTFTLVLPKTL